MLQQAGRRGQIGRRFHSEEPAIIAQAVAAAVNLSMVRQQQHVGFLSLAQSGGAPLVTVSSHAQPESGQR